jgi:hypothetical protein
MPERKPHGPIQLPEWESGDPFDPSTLNAVFGIPAVAVDTWVYDNIHDNHGYHWDIDRPDPDRKGVNSVDFFPATGLLFISGSRLKNPTVLQDAKPSPKDTVDMVAFSVNKLRAESTENHGTVTFTIYNTYKYGERVRIHSTGAIAMLAPEKRIGGSMRASQPEFFTPTYSSESASTPLGWDDGAHN